MEPSGSVVGYPDPYMERGRCNGCYLVFGFSCLCHADSPHTFSGDILTLLYFLSLRARLHNDHIVTLLSTN